MRKLYYQKIHETGTPRLLIFGVAQLGCTPEKREKNWTIHECNEEVNMFASLYNEALIKMLQQLKEELLSSMIYTYFDIFKSMQDINSNPAHYGTLRIRIVWILNFEITSNKLRDE